MGSRSSKVGDFIKRRRSDITGKHYARWIREIVGDGNAFLKLKPKEQKRVITDYILKRRDKLSGSSMHVMVGSVKSFLDYYNVKLPWKQIFDLMHPRRVAARDRAPTVQEIRKLLDVCDTRLKAAVLVLASSGMRVGAIEPLRMQDYQKVRHNGITLGKIIVYKGSSEEYDALISPEAVEALDKYHKKRERAGEKFTPTSLLFRDQWDANRLNSDGIEKPVHLTTKNLQDRIGLKWREAGVWTSFNDGGKSRHEFKQLHGFRKFFETNAPTRMDTQTAYQDVRVLKGAIYSYYKPTFEHLCGQYVRALPSLTISEAAEKERILQGQEGEIEKLKAQIEEKDKGIREARQDIITVKKELEIIKNAIVNMNVGPSMTTEKYKKAVKAGKVFFDLSRRLVDEAEKEKGGLKA